MIREKLDEAYKKWSKIKVKAPMSRREFLWKIAMAKEAEDGIAAKKHIKNIIKIEEQRKQAKSIKIMRRLNKKKGVFKTTFMENGKMKEIIDKRGIENAIIKQNKIKFSQTKGSPSQIGSLFKDIGPLAEKSKVQQILNSTYKPKKEIDRHT